eukprot:Tbor_TRINITY_DN2909_c0_g1::TRINITY_DN2909_c0_g1_i1::g.1076::m.1076/K05607/AUH; methylglutaconyl-CoA hydratase
MLRRCIPKLLMPVIPKHTECILSLDNNIASIVLARPSRKNAIGKVFLHELETSFNFCKEHDNVVRAIVLSSSVEGVFCAGADLKERKDMSPDEARLFVDRIRLTFSLFEDLPMPTLAAIEGAALGGGLELAMGADIRIAGVNAKLGVPETGLAIIPGAGGTQRLTRLVGPSHAKHLIFTGAPVSGQRAYEIGLVNECVTVGGSLEAALAMAKRIASNGPIAVRAAKKAIVEGLQKPTRAEAMAVERECYELVLGTEDRLEGLRAFQEKRRPVYQGK